MSHSTKATHDQPRQDLYRAAGSLRDKAGVLFAKGDADDTAMALRDIANRIDALREEYNTICPIASPTPHPRS